MERSARLIAAFLVGLPAGLIAQTRQDGGTRSLLQLEDDWAKAVVRRDGAVFRKMLAANFVYTEDARTMDRETVLREITTGSDTVTAAHNEDMRIHPFGTAAVVTGWLVMSGRGPQGPFDRRYRFTDTWMKRGNQWQIVAAHDYLVPAKRGS
jgi:ketosteroid isomerase-like protein